jgi:predicted nucleic acid-binding protein
LILLDTSGLYSAIDAGQPEHERVLEALRDEPGPLVLSPFVLAEVDYFILTRMTSAHELALLDEVAAGAFDLARFETDDIARARAVIERYGDLDVGLTDASIVVLADRYGTNRVLTLDERHFRALRTSNGQPLTLLPADA